MHFVMKASIPSCPNHTENHSLYGNSVKTRNTIYTVLFSDLPEKLIPGMRTLRANTFATCSQSSKDGIEYQKDNRAKQYQFSTGTSVQQSLQRLQSQNPYTGEIRIKSN